MFIDGRKYPPRNPCIICGTEDGEIRTLDGMVCRRCMPADLFPKAASQKKYQIVAYARTHDGYRTCVDMGEETATGPTVCGDRCMAITSADGIVLADELNSRIAVSDSADIVVSFIKMSGLNLLIDNLRRLTEKGGNIRVITTAYMGNTEVEAVMELSGLRNTEVRMEVNADSTRLHAKSMIFRNGGTRTAYVGSANISKSALTSGEEWVVKIRGEDEPAVIDDLERGFDHLWEAYGLVVVGKNTRSTIERALERRGRMR